jgi:hypothetical protein
MAKNKESGDDRRVGAVKRRSQVKNPVTGTWTKRDDKTGKVMDVKADPKPFKGVRKERDPIREWHVKCRVTLDNATMIIKARTLEEAKRKTEQAHKGEWSWEDIQYAQGELVDWTVTGEPTLA